jgi:hypothetical protein
MRTYAVTLPIAGHAYVMVQAENEEAAIDKAFDEVTHDDIESWEALRQFNAGNVCYCPHPWEVEVEDETPEE